MRILILIAVMVCGVCANPIQDREDIDLVKIPLEGGQELDILTLANNPDGTMSERTKRTIGILRELFPTISQIIDQKIQMIAAYLFRTLGPIILRSGLGGGAGGGGQTNSKTDLDDDDDFGSDEDDDEASNNDSRKVSISLPTFPPESADDDDDDKDEKNDDKNELRKRSSPVLIDSKEPTKFDLFSGLNDDATNNDSSSVENTTNSKESKNESNLVR